MTQNTYLVDKELYVVNADAEIDEKVDTPVIADGKLYVVDYQYWCSDDKYFINPSKIIAATNTTNPSLSSVDKFDWPGEVDAEDFANSEEVNHWATKVVPECNQHSEEDLKFGRECFKSGAQFGYKAAPKKEYSDEDMRKAFGAGYAYRNRHHKTDNVEQFFSSLRPTPTYIEFEEQKVNGKLIVKTLKY